MLQDKENDMSLQAYGLLKCKAVAMKEERDNNKPHYHIHVKANEEDYRISINIKGSDPLAELLFYTKDNFKHQITLKIRHLPYGFYYNQQCAMDYIRGNLGFDRSTMRKIPHDRPGPNNDLNEKLSAYINEAIQSQEADIYVFGAMWRSSNYCKSDRIFDFQPSMGMHDIHMNQGNSKYWKKDNGVWQDGCILIHFTSKDQWIGIFLAFQSQSWTNDDCTGYAKHRH